MTQLKLYGENAFTFLFFNEINGDEGKLKKLLESLKQFDRPKSKFLDTATLDLKNEPEIWLFPSFGKRQGFGEPDAVLLVDKYVFWFEVETMFDLDGSDQSKAIDSLRQLYRFHCAALAFAKGPRRDSGGLFIKGPTITNGDQRKSGRLALRGHKAAAKLRDRLKAACKAGKSHYVLLSVGQPSGGAKGFHKELNESAHNKFKMWDSILGWSGGTNLLQLDHCWYTYWYGDLNRFFNEDDLAAGYVPIKKGS
jgi:hypothetical protein